MKLRALLLSFLAPWAQVKPPILDFLRLLNCIAEIENSPITYVSPSGARGTWQIQESTWKQYSQKPFSWASTFGRLEQIEARRVALAHAHWIVSQAIPALGLPSTPYTFALVWGPGYGNTQRLNLTGSNVDYAKRFENLYNDSAPHGDYAP